jgi:hypothetical protein
MVAARMEYMLEQSDIIVPPLWGMGCAAYGPVEDTGVLRAGWREVGIGAGAAGRQKRPMSLVRRCSEKQYVTPSIASSTSWRA